MLLLECVTPSARFVVPHRNGTVNFVLSVKSPDRQGLAFRTRQRSPRLGSAGSVPPLSARDAYLSHHRDRQRRDDALSHVPVVDLRHATLDTNVGERLLAPKSRPADGVPLEWHRRAMTTQFTR